MRLPRITHVILPSVRGVDLAIGSPIEMIRLAAHMTRVYKEVYKLEPDFFIRPAPPGYPMEC
jgi:hypothetical protein